MSAIPAQPTLLSAEIAGEHASLLTLERHKSILFRCWIVTGLFFMVLPGTVLGFSNLLAISAHHGLGGLAPAWIQAHGFSQVFGWIGTFVLGIGFYSQPHTRISRSRLPLICWILWTAGLMLHWLAAGYLWWWRITLPAAGLLQFAAMLLFLRAAREHKLPSAAVAQHAGPRMEPWMQTVLVSNTAFLVALGINVAVGFRLALTAAAPEIPHAFDQGFLVLLGWGFLAPLVWGFSARWLPTFLGGAPVRGKLLQVAVGLDLAGVVLGMAHQTRLMTPLLVAAAILVALAIRVFEKPTSAAKTLGLHPSFPAFLRIAYAWSMVASLLGVWAAWSDVHGGIWGGSRHALTVGFAATMVMTVGPRILPHFAGVRGIWSRNLMFATLLLLCAGCTLRISMEPLAYEGLWPFAWELLPLSGCLELAAVLLFAIQLVLSFALEPSIFADRREAASQAA
ncbi:MAG TPA: hypothetical protein VIY53_11390 [Acidobacteriaceae bacterium]